ncbi:YwmB family TATA-box binding protein [Virgibacillus kekensis]|uniref:YwmB family TATA-box binding protein n=1 Tax=Virgibacillus kekensis TaxID=202261 RepID=A0ABV9DIB3_9BACI
MRKSLLIAIIILISATNVSAGDGQNEEMSGIAELVNNSKLEIDGWQVTIKEQMSPDKAHDLMKKIKTKNSHLVTGTEDENTIKYTFRYVQKDSDFTEIYNVLIPKDKNYQAQFTAVLKGENWSNAVEKSYFMRLNNLKNSFFSEDSTKFACLTTSISDKIDTSSFFAEMEDSLNIDYSRTQIDNLENSTIKEIKYGYTPLWSNQFKIMGKPINLQIATIEKGNGLVRLVIGTPILINEY